MRDFIEYLHEHGGENLNAEDIADFLWLMAQLPQPKEENVSPGDSVGKTTPPNSVPTTPRPLEQPGGLDRTPALPRPSGERRADAYLPGSQREGGAGPGIASLPFRSPSATALPQRLALGRALRPLKRTAPSSTRLVLDEEATVQRIADERNWLPVLRPARERWLELVLLTDESPSMTVWYELVGELQALLEQSGAFRTVQRWGFYADPEQSAAVRFYAGSRFWVEKPHFRQAGELNDPRGRRLILLVSDCVSAAWRQPAINQMLASWKDTPTTLVQVLPERLWGRTGMRFGQEAALRARQPGLPNLNLLTRSRNQPNRNQLPPGFPLPVVTLEPELLALWSRGLAAKGNAWMLGVLFPQESATPPTPTRPTGERQAPNAQGIFDSFHRGASEGAQLLARYLSAMPLNLPVMRLVQQVMFDEPRQGHLAEVLLSGMVERKPGQSRQTPPDAVEYEFVDGARDLLRRAAGERDMVIVLSRTSAFVDANSGLPIDFPTLLADPSRAGSLHIDAKSRPFAILVAETLQRMGGSYALLAEHLDKRLSEGIPPRVQSGGVAEKGTMTADGAISDDDSIHKTDVEPVTEAPISHIDSEATVHGTGQTDREAAPDAPRTLDAFLRRASGGARLLAGYLSAVPLNLPVMRLVQQVMFDEPRQSHLAEVLLSGLLQRKPGQDWETHPDAVEYEFIDGARDLLRRSAGERELLIVLSRTSVFVDANDGLPIDFPTLLADPSRAGSLQIDDKSLPFAAIAAETLQRMGGSYALLAEHLDERLSGGVLPRVQSGGVVEEGVVTVDDVTSTSTSSEITTQRAELAKLDYSSQALDTTLAEVLRLYSIWDEVTPEDQDAIQSRRRALAVALARDGISGEETELLLVDFLRGLEAIDSVVRLAHAERRRGKQPDTFRSAGRGTVNAAALDALAAAPSTGGDPLLDASATVPYHLNLSFPKDISSQDESLQLLAIQLVTNKPPQSQADVTLNLEFIAPDVPELIEIHLTAPGFEETTSVYRRTLVIYKSDDSDPAHFSLKLLDKSPGDKEIRLDFYHLGYPIGSATFKSEVSLFNMGEPAIGTPLTGRPPIRTGRAPLLGGRPGVPQPQPEPEPEETKNSGTASLVEGIDGLRFVKPGTQPPDVILRVVRDADGATLHFKLFSPKGKVGYREKEMGKVTIRRLKDPTLFLADYFADLNTMAQSSIDSQDPAQAQIDLERTMGIGNTFYEQIFPEELKEEYWRLKGLRDEGKIETLLVLSDEPWIPWEMVYPYRDEDTPTDFLAGSWHMSRWQAGLALNPELNVQTVQLVATALDLEFVQEEKEYFDNMSIALPQISVLDPITDRARFLAQIKEGNIQLLHFATHSNFEGENADRSLIHLEMGEVIEPVDMTGPGTAGIRRERPLVFLNACHSGRQKVTLTGLGGWAERMVKQVAATAFVGAYWEINDPLASLFARTFYDKLRGGATLAVAFHTARQTIRSVAPTNPTWLAYTLYGHPNCRITFGK